MLQMTYAETRVLYEWPIMKYSVRSSVQIGTFCSMSRLCDDFVLVKRFVEVLF